MKYQEPTREEFNQIIPDKTRLSLYLALLLADMSYSIFHDANKDLERRGCVLKHEEKKLYNTMRTYAKKTEYLLQCIPSNYLKQTDDELFNTYITLSEIYQECAKNLFDKLISAIEYEEDINIIWNALESCKSINAIEYHLPKEFLEQDEDDNDNQVQD